MGEFDGRVAIVTGSSSGIGEAIARRLSELGCRVVVNSSSSVAAGTAVAESLPSEALYVQADISDQAQGQALIARTIERFGRLDVLVNNAGWTRIVKHADLDALTDEIQRRTFEVNVFGTWSIAYAMSKAALNHLTALLAKSCGPVRVNAVAPGLIDTPLSADLHDQRAAVAAAVPLHRSGRPQDCAEAVIGLLRNAYVTGHVMVVDGGNSLVW